MCLHAIWHCVVKLPRHDQFCLENCHPQTFYLDHLNEQQILPYSASSRDHDLDYGLLTSLR